MKTELKIETSYTVDGRIIQETCATDMSPEKIIDRRVIDTREKQIRDALIALGWTPPKS